MTKTEERGRRKTRVGEVVGDKMEKTAVVAVTRLVRHRKFPRATRTRGRIFS